MPLVQSVGKNVKELKKKGWRMKRIIAAALRGSRAAKRKAGKPLTLREQIAEHMMKKKAKARA